MGQIKIPGVGPVSQKTAIAGGLVVAGIAGVAWWRHMNAGPAADEEETATADFTEGGDYVYGDPGTAFATDYAYDGAYPYPGGGGGGYFPPTTTVTNPDPVTNSEWTQRSIEHLNLVGVESNVGSLAVSRYLLKECLTATQADIVRQAVAALGPPPQGQFSIVVCQAAPGGGGGGGGGGGPLAAPARVFATSVSRTSVRFGWDRVPGASKYLVQQTGASGTWQTIGTSGDNQHSRSGLRPGTRHTFRVAGVDAAGQVGAYRTKQIATKK